MKSVTEYLIISNTSYCIKVGSFNFFIIPTLAMLYSIIWLLNHCSGEKKVGSEMLTDALTKPHVLKEVAYPG